MDKRIKLTFPCPLKSHCWREKVGSLQTVTRQSLNVTSQIEDTSKIGLNNLKMCVEDIGISSVLFLVICRIKIGIKHSKCKNSLKYELIELGFCGPLQDSSKLKSLMSYRCKVRLQNRPKSQKLSLNF